MRRGISAGNTGSTARLAGQTLLLDADDTLWENNIYFEAAIAAFLIELDHTPHSREQIREHLDRCELQNIHRLGYGLHSFEASLVQCFSELSQAPVSAAVRARFSSFARGIARHEIERMPGVEETLPQLAGRHQLVLVTKGVPEEQCDKLQRSGLAKYFSAVEVLDEKSPAHFTGLMTKYAWNAETTWMIGNSPKSDIHASLSAGLNAVHIPHPVTWVLEHCEICEPHPGRRRVEVKDFSGLLALF